jgi:hypothetical protein
MDYLIVALVALFVGYKISGIIHVISFKRILDDLNISNEDLRQVAERMDLDDHISPRPSSAKQQVLIKVEQVQGQLFAYDLQQATFLAQGSSSEELIQRLLEKMPVNTQIVCDIADGGELITDAVERLRDKQA